MKKYVRITMENLQDPSDIEGELFLSHSRWSKKMYSELLKHKERGVSWMTGDPNQILQMIKDQLLALENAPNEQKEHKAADVANLVFMYSDLHSRSLTDSIVILPFSKEEFKIGYSKE